ncbi:hypothetical protein ACFQES_15650 [Nonomuraea salmonea]|uniref:hypothetical protein n=1 Tax=Nonomuraea salmonea TaxID=46181 RepID=UPI003621C3DE
MDVLARDRRRGLHDREQGREAERQRDEQEVRARGERELQAGEVEGVHAVEPPPAASPAASVHGGQPAYLLG